MYGGADQLRLGEATHGFFTISDFTPRNYICAVGNYLTEP